MSGFVQSLRKVHLAKAFYLTLLVAGVLLYLLWAIYYNAWLDIGLYSIVILLVGFGLFGYLLYRIAPDGGKK
jgi:hypothetical protein